MRPNAYTLVELLIAVSLSVTIMLIAFTAFRFCAASFQALNRLATENDIMRRGAIVAYDTIDSWADQAEPGYPWCKGYNSLAIADTTLGLDTPSNKRIFRRVTFQPAGNANFNPNWVQPHDPRSWYRNHIGHSPRPYMLSPTYGGWGWAPFSTFPGTPSGWEGRHVFGDYSLLSNTAMDPATDPRGARPRLMLDLYVGLGMLGVADYMPAGTLTLIQQPSTNLANRDANPTDPRYVFNIGEIPYSTGDYRNHTGLITSASNSLPLDTVTFTGLAAGTPPPNITTTSPGINTGNYHRANYFEGLAGQFGGMPLGANNTGASTNAGRMPSQSWALDFSGYNDLPLYYGGVPTTTNGTSWNWDLLNLTIRAPWGGGRKDATQVRILYDKALIEIKPLYAGSPFTEARDYGTTLYLLPQTYANNPQPDLTNRPANLPAVSLSMLRYRWRSADFSGATVRVVQPETGVVLELNVFATGTTFRGARQHWALESDDPATPAFDPTMGDAYQ